MLKKSLFLLIVCLSAVCSALAQETESAVSSNLTQISLPANAQRLLPESVPAEVSQTLEKLVAEGGGKLKQGNSEVLVWTGSSYQNIGKITVINRLTDTLKVAGWKYEVGGEENGVTVFSLLKEGKQRQGIIGFYGESEGTLVLAWMEVLPSESAQNPKVENTETRSNAVGSIVGSWDNGRVSMVTRQNTITGATAPGSSTRFEYQFTADGRFQFTGLAKTTNYSCTDTLYNEKAGRYSLNGTTLTLTPTKNYWKKTNSCSAKGNSEKNYTLAKETYQIAIKTDDYGKQLICLNSGNGEACYRRME